MKNLVLGLLAVCQCIISVAQTDDINHRKYWYYRSRLTNDFMKVGPNPGESLPMSCRGKYAPLGYGHGRVCQVGTDAVSQLGPYICVLATEYKMLKDNGQPTDSTLREIYFALEAFNRLDLNAESVYGYANSLNGFFIREDVPCDFLENISNKRHFNYNLNINPVDTTGFCSLNHAINIMGRDKDPKDASEEPYCYWSNKITDSTRISLAMSLDQCINMFNACALINKYFSTEAYMINAVPQQFADYKTNIRDEARAISSRMINALQGNGEWIIRMPNNNAISEGNGGVVGPLSFAFSEADCKIQKDNGSNNSIELCVNGMTGSGSANFLSSSLGWIAWSGYTSDAGVVFDVKHPDNAPKAAGLEAACNCDYDITRKQVLVSVATSVVNFVTGLFNHIVNGAPMPTYQWQDIVHNNTEIRIENRAAYFELNWSDLLRKILHGGTNANSGNFNYSAFLNSAPCDGPRYYTSDGINNPSYRWTTVDNIDHAGGASTTNAEFNGIDYMLYHNLWYIDNAYSSSVDLRYRLLNENYPLSALSAKLGSNTNPLYVPAYEYITADNSINASNPTVQSDPNNGNVVYRAGKQIHLKPGFSVNPGAYFHGYIQKFGCMAGNDVNRMASSGDSTHTSNDYSDQSAYVGPTSYVQYPPEKNAQDIVQTASSQPPVRIGSKQKQVEALLSKSNFMIYPNPNNGLFNMEFDLSDNETSIVSITNMLNDVVYNTTLSSAGHNKLDIDLSRFDKGVYVVKFSSTKGANIINRIVVQ